MCVFWFVGFYYGFGFVVWIVEVFLVFLCVCGGGSFWLGLFLFFFLISKTSVESEIAKWYVKKTIARYTY